MTTMKKKQTKNRLLDRQLKISFTVRSLLLILFMVTFVTTASITLFVQGGLLENNRELITKNATNTFINVFVISVLFWLIATVYRRITSEKPLIRILEATYKIRTGDFSARITKLHRKPFRNEYDLIAENINKMAEELAGVETMKTDFIANVSHEMKTPLSVIQNYATILQQPDLSEEERLKFSKEISLATKQMTSLITNMLKLNKLENQQIFPENTAFDIAEQIRECLLESESIFERKELTLITDIDDEIIINGDPEMGTIIWNNLLSNAVKFTPHDGKIFVKVKQSGDNAFVTFTDTGIGMTKDELPRIFDKFWQADSSHATKGNGLGLALVKKICDIYGYSIKAESEKGLGTTFTVRIPLTDRTDTI